MGLVIAVPRQDERRATVQHEYGGYVDIYTLVRGAPDNASAVTGQIEFYFEVGTAFFPFQMSKVPQKLKGFNYRLVNFLVRPEHQQRFAWCRLAVCHLNSVNTV